MKLHPDKNPDNPNAASEFHKLSKILEILTDESARKAYDKVLKGRKEAALRHRELDSKRRKLKEDLEARERSSRNFNNQRTAEGIFRVYKVIYFKFCHCMLFTLSGRNRKTNARRIQASRRGNCTYY